MQLLIFHAKTGTDCYSIIQKMVLRILKAVRLGAQIYICNTVNK